MVIYRKIENQLTKIPGLYQNGSRHSLSNDITLPSGHLPGTSLMLDTGPVLLNSFDTSGTLTGIPRSWIIIMIRVKKNINRILKNNKITTSDVQ